MPLESKSRAFSAAFSVPTSSLEPHEQPENERFVAILTHLVWKMILGFLHHESLIQGAQILQAALALGWMALGCGVIKLWWRKK
jgi:hypothetical protein